MATAGANAAAGASASGHDKSFDPRFAGATREELNMLRYVDPSAPSDTGATLALELKVLVKSLRVKYGKQKELERCLFQLRSALLALPQQEAVSESQVGLAGFKLFQQHSSEVTLDFRPPAGVDVVGSFLLHTLSRPNLNVDVAVVMPAACFSRKDTVNHRYHDKRALYLGVVAKALLKLTRGASPLFKSVKVEAFGGDMSKPVLVCKPAARRASRFVVRLHAAIPPSAFQHHRLAPSFSNVRPAATGLGTAVAAEADGAAVEPPTPVYNASVLADMHMQLQLRTFHEALTAAPAVAEALVVLKSWLRCRGDGALPDAFTGFHLTALVVYLVQTRVVARNMVSYQIVRTVFEWLSKNSLADTPIVLSPPKDAVPETGNPNTLPQDKLAEFRARYDVVFVGPSHVLNLAAAMTRASAASLKRDADVAMLSMRSHRPLAEGSRHVFAHPCRASQRYDRVFAMPYPPRPTARNATGADVTALCDRHWCRVVEERVVAVVAKALTDRAVHVRVIKCGGQRDGAKSAGVDELGGAPLQWTPTEAPADPASGMLWLGIVLNPDNANRIVDKGPPADHATEAAAFRAFWGDKAELRRFQDGSILEAAVWERSLGLRPTIVHDIVSYVLTRHLRVPKDAVVWPARDMEAVLEPAASTTGASVAEATLTALQAFNTLSAALKDLPHMPLGVKTVQHASPELRYTSVRPPMPHPLCGDSAAKGAKGEASRVVRPLDVVVTMDSSSLWPEDLEATRATKTAFYLKFGYGLKSKHKIRSSVGKEWIDVFVGGFAFRVVIYHARELVLLRHKARLETAAIGVGGSGNAVFIPDTAAGSHAAGFVAVGGSDTSNNRARAAHSKARAAVEADPAARARQRALLEEAAALERNLVHKPVHGSSVRGLMMKHPAMAGTVRLALRWLSAHLFSNHMPHEAVELTVAHLFLDSRPYMPPHAPAPAFLRWLELMSTFDWERQPLLVDVNGEAAPHDSAALLTKFKWWRKTRPGFAPMFIATPADRPLWQPVWATEAPGATVLARLRQFARSTLAALEAVLAPTGSTDRPSWTTAFTTPLHDYDVLVKLDPKRLPFVADDGTTVLAPATAAGDDDSAPDGAAAPVKSKYLVPLFKNLTAASRRQLLIGFDPLALFLRDAQAELGSKLLLFADTHRCAMGPAANTVGVVWKRDVFGGSPTTTFIAAASAPGALSSEDDDGSADDTRARRLMMACLSSMGVLRALGAGVVDRVQLTGSRQAIARVAGDAVTGSASASAPAPSATPGSATRKRKSRTRTRSSSAVSAGSAGKAPAASEEDTGAGATSNGDAQTPAAAQPANGAGAGAGAGAATPGTPGAKGTTPVARRTRSKRKVGSARAPSRTSKAGSGATGAATPKPAASKKGKAAMAPKTAPAKRTTKRRRK